MNKKISFTLCVVLLTSSLCLSSCALFVPRLEAPEVSLVNMAFTEVTLFETVALFTVRIDNENPRPLELEATRHKIMINGSYIGKGYSDEDLTIAPFSSREQEIEVHLSNLSIIKDIHTMVNQPGLSYEIESTVYLRSPFSPRLVSHKRGTFDFVSTPKTN